MPEVKQEVLRLLVEGIVVEDNAITIKHIIPTDDNSRLLPRDYMQEYPDCNIPKCHSHLFLNTCCLKEQSTAIR